MKSFEFFRSGLFIILLTSVIIAQADSANRPTEASPGSIYFTENLGQFGEKTLFRGESGNVIFYLCRDEAAYLFVRDTDELIEDELYTGHDDMPGLSEHPRYKKEGMLIKAQFIGANPDAEIMGENRLPHENNYFLGSDPANWRTNVPNYSSVVYKNIYPGIDLRYYGSNAALKYDFIVRPGADLFQIRVRYDDIDRLSISGAGDLEIETEFGVISEKAPYAYQNVDGITQKIPAGYEIIESDVFGFRVNGDYDQSQPLVIDPQLIYSTYFGGTGNDEFDDIEVDSEWNFYLLGETQAADFQVANPYQGTLGGYYDLCVVKFDSSGQNLIFSTYLGGSGSEDPSTIELYENGNKIYILGYSGSSDFPLVNPFQGNYNGEMDYVVAVMSITGDSLEYSTYFGGTGWEYWGSIDVDGQGNAYITGSTYSIDFPIVNALDPNNNGGRDVFLAKFNYYNSTYDVAFSTFLGGSDDERACDIVIGDGGRIYISGMTESPDFPMVNAYDSTYNIYGIGDIFIAIVSPNGDSLLYSTFLGGSSTDRTNGIALDSDGNIYLAGSSGSDDYPVVNAYNDAFSGGDNWWGDAFVSVLSSGGDSLLYSTYFGGNNGDVAEDISVNDSGIVYISGYTRSADFPVVNAYDYSWNGRWDAFAAVLDIEGGCCLFSTYLGGDWYDEGARLEIVDDNFLYLCGYTESDDFPLVNPIDFTRSVDEGFVSIFSLDNMDIVLGGISGLVRTTAGLPISEARLTLSVHGMRDTTDTNGNFAFPDLCPGVYDITVSHGLYFDTVVTDVFVDAQGNTTNLEIILEEAWYPPGENCFDPFVISDSTFPIVVSGNSDGFENDYYISDTSGLCWQGRLYQGAGNGPDVAYSWVVPQTGSYNFDLCDEITNSFYTVIFLWDYTCPHEPTLLDDFICGALASGCNPLSWYARLMDIELAQGQEVLIVVDGLAHDSQGDFELTISLTGAIAGVVTDSLLNPLEGVRVEVVGEGYSTTTDSAGEYILGSAPSGYNDISFSKYHYWDHVVEDVLINPGETTYVDVQMALHPDEVVFWFGHSDGSPVPVPIGDTISIDAYAWTGDSVYVGFLHLPLGTSDEYIIDHLSETEGEFYYPLSQWDEVYFQPATVLSDGWHSQSLIGWHDITGGPNPLLHVDTPTRICTFAFETVNDSSLVGNTVQCFMVGFDPINGDPMAGDPDGVTTYLIRQYFSPLYFIDPSIGCYYTVGDVNDDHTYNGLDIVYAVNYFKGGAAPPYTCNCPPHGEWHVSGDVNGSCTFNGLDITYGVAYFKGGPGPIPCSDCPPLSMNSALPDDNDNINDAGMRIPDEKGFSIRDGKVKK